MKKIVKKSLRGPEGVAIISFSATHGAIAQLGERLHGMQEVSGSIPLGSTTFRTLGLSDQVEDFRRPHRLEA